MRVLNSHKGGAYEAFRRFIAEGATYRVEVSEPEIARFLSGEVLRIRLCTLLKHKTTRDLLNATERDCLETACDHLRKGGPFRLCKLRFTVVDTYESLNSQGNPSITHEVQVRFLGFDV